MAYPFIEDTVADLPPEKANRKPLAVTNTAGYIFGEDFNKLRTALLDTRGYLRSQMGTTSDALVVAQLADSARVGAETAQAAAEAARDAAAVTGTVYPDTATGLAATAEGAFFNVPSASPSDSLILYRKVSGAASEVVRYPSAAIKTTVDTLDGRFAYSASPNLYDPSAAVDGKYYRNDTSGDATSATGAQSGLMPVEEGKSYALSVQTPWTLHGVLHFWGAAGRAEPKGNTHPTSTVPLPAGVNAVQTGGGRIWTFSVPVGSGIRFVGANFFVTTVHTTADFNAIRNATQMEVGTAPGKFVPYGTTVTLQSTALPSGLENAATRLQALETQTVDGRFRLVKEGNHYYLRFPFSAAKDLCIQVDLVDDANGVFSMESTFLVPVGAYDGGVAAYNAAPNIIHNQGDEMAPVRYNSETLGAGHGHTKFVTLTAAGHGKTTADIGSRWVDGAGKNWTLIKIPDANTLWVLSDYTKAGDVWAFSTTQTGNLAHVSGATNTAAVTVTGRSTGTNQMYPSAKSLTKQVLVNGVADIASAADGTYAGCAFVEFVNTYELTDLASVLDYVTAHPGAAVDFAAPEIETGAKLSLVYRYLPNGSCVVYHSLRALKQLAIGACGFVQSAKLTQSGTQKLYEYIPGVLPFPGSTKTWDFAKVEDISTSVDSCTFGPTYWVDASKPPNRMAQVLKEADGTPVAGFMLGYSPMKGRGVPALHAAGTSYAIDMRNTRKQYPNVMSDGSTTWPSGDCPAGSYVEVVAYRTYWNPAAQPRATVCTYVEDGPDAIFFLDYHTNVAFESIGVPARFRGRSVSVVERSDSLTVHNTVVGPDGLLVSVTGGYGYAVLRLT